MTAVPDVVVKEFTPFTVVPPVSAKLTVQLPVDKLLSSPFSVAVIVNAKLTVGLLFDVSKVIE